MDQIEVDYAWLASLAHDLHGIAEDTETAPTVVAVDAAALGSDAVADALRRAGDSHVQASDDVADAVRELGQLVEAAGGALQDVDDQLADRFS